MTIVQIGESTEGFTSPPAPCPPVPQDPFTDIYCGEEFQLNVSSHTHKDIPITPNVYGTTDPNIRIFLKKGGTIIDETRSLPDGKFSFFVPLGNYTLQKEDGSIKNINPASSLPINF